MRVVFVTAEGDGIREEDVDRPLHEAAFDALDVDLEYRCWSDTSTDWESFDLVVLRSPWDYSERLVEYTAWLDSVADLATLQNPAGLVRWNLDKAYLLDLESMGVPIVRTRLASELDGVLLALNSVGSAEVIVKPAVSAGSRLTGWFEAGDTAAVDLARQILSEGGNVLVEPFIRSVASQGEVSVVMFDGHLSHSFRKGPILKLGGGLRGDEYQENVAPYETTGEQTNVVLAAADAARRIAERQGWLPPGVPLLYSRFDLVELDDGTSALLEAELFEPSFFLGTAEGSAGRFADACVHRIEHLRRGASPNA